MPNLLYIGCLGYSNLGDEACLAGFEMLMSGLLPADWRMSALNGYDFKGDESFDALVLGGGTLLSPHGNLGDPALIEARRRGIPYFIFGTGLESPDWETLPPVDQLAEFRALVEGAVSIALRGHQSREYLAHIGIPEERLQVVGDLAAALTAPPRVDQPRGRRLGVNVGTSFGRVYGRDEGRLVDTLVAALEAIAGDVDEIHFIPVWDRDLTVQREVARRVSSSATVVEMDQLPDINELIGALGRMDTLIAMKLHAGILAAVAHTPYVPWSYRPKVEDFAAEIGLRDFVVRTDAPASALISAWRRLVKDQEPVRQRLSHEVSSMRARLRRAAANLVHALKERCG